MKAKNSNSMARDIALLGGEDYQCVRRIEFEKAYIYSHGEQMQADAERPMMTQVHITPLRLDVNANVRLDRRWPETSGFHWQKYEEPEVKYAKETSNGSVRMVDAYWIDDNNNKQRVFELNKSVVLYFEVENYIVGENVETFFEDSDFPEKKFVSYFGMVDSDGMVVINNFKLEYKK